jgi:hypothetical protein
MNADAILDKCEIIEFYERANGLTGRAHIVKMLRSERLVLAHQTKMTIKKAPKNIDFIHKFTGEESYKSYLMDQKWGIESCAERRDY